MEFTLLWSALTGVAAIWAGTRIWSERLPDRPVDRLVGAAAVGLLVGRLVEMLAQGINPITNLGDIIIVRGGVSTAGATVGAIVALLWGSRWRPEPLDALAPASLAGLAGWHAGCVWRSACLGTPSDLPWAWAQEGSDVTRHPVELYAALGLLVAAIIVSRLPWRLLTRAGAALGLAALTRLATEPMRPSITGGPVGWYVAAMVIGLVVIVFGNRLEGAREPVST